MTVPTQQYRPIGTLAVEMATASVLVAGVVTTVLVTLRSQSVLATPATFITDNSLENEVVSRAGLDEDTTFTGYTLASTTVHGTEYVYVITAAVSTA